MPHNKRVQATALQQNLHLEAPPATPIFLMVLAICVTVTLGWHSYAWLVGFTPEAPNAMVKSLVPALAIPALIICGILVRAHRKARKTTAR